jgi:hypothetical protein
VSEKIVSNYKGKNAYFCQIPYKLSQRASPTRRRDADDDAVSPFAECS